MALIIIGAATLALLAASVAAGDDSRSGKALNWVLTRRGMWDRRLGLIISAVVGGALLVAGIALAVGGQPSTAGALIPSAGNLLPVDAHAPAGTPTNTFTPPGLSVRMTVPADWRSVSPRSGFQYMMQGSQTPQGFVGVARVNGQTTPPSVNLVASNRRTFLRRIGAAVATVRTGTIDGYRGYMLRYSLPVPGGAVLDTEYDIIIPGPLLVSLSPTQTTYEASVTTYNDVVIVLGTPSMAPAPATLDWIASTIQAN